MIRAYKNISRGAALSGQRRKGGEPGGSTPGDPDNDRVTLTLTGWPLAWRQKARGRGGECSVPSKLNRLFPPSSKLGEHTFPYVPNATPLSQVGGHFGFVVVSKPNLFPSTVQSPPSVGQLMPWPPNLETKMHNKLEDQVEQTNGSPAPPFPSFTHSVSMSSKYLGDSPKC